MNLKDFYLIFECSGSRYLQIEARRAGHPTWVPTQINDVIRKDRSGNRYVEKVRQCVIPGYVFVRGDGVREFRRWVPSKYQTRPLTMPTAPVGSKQEIWDESREPVRYPADRLERFAQRLAEQKAPTEADEVREYWFKEGDRVDILDHPLIPDIIGAIVGRCRSDGTIKVRLPNGRRISIHKACLKPSQINMKG